ncbi:vacuolar segregation subunit 7-domain-containing protein [Halenospora varia]|nr:vacuolar segregation subunit 7-domain-containing protein [Halenospora varia]
MSSENNMSSAMQEPARGEPIDTGVASSTEQKRSTTPKPGQRDSSTSSTRTTKKLHPKRAPSATNSPIPSRESSPVRPNIKSTTSNPNRPAGPGRPRKNSSQDVSPSRSSNTITNPPSAAATQRALSAASIPSLYPSLSESAIRAPVPQKPPVTSEIKDTPRWPTSPRLRSPPPINKLSVLSPRKTEHEVPSINVQRSLPTTEKQEGKQGTLDSEAEESLSVTGMRTPARGASGASSTLETVQEISQPNTPARGLDGTSEKAEFGTSTFDQDASGRTKLNLAANESGSDNSSKGEIRMRSTSVVPVTTLRPSAPAVKPFVTGTGRGKSAAEGSTRNMTVETETVTSIPQNLALGGPGGNGSLRAKPSSETIRPKKEKKKQTRKTPSVTSGTGEQPISSRPRLHHHPSTRASSYPPFARSPELQNGQGPFSSASSSGATSPDRQSAPPSRRPSLSVQSVSSLLTRNRPASSKADIFEAKVASAVDEANSSDSDETFVYESNPPDAADRPRRYHSRTPSATSMASQIDQRNGPRSTIDGGHSVAMKKSMKFAHSFASNSAQDSTTGDDDGKGTARSNMGTGRGTTHHHHIGRWGRNGGNGHASLFDNESPFPNASKSKLSGSVPRHTSQPTSPRLSSNSRLGGNGKRTSPIGSGYDLDEAADDERTPLMASVRSGRSGRGRRPLGSMRQLEHQASREDRSFLARFAGCLVLSIMIILVVSGAIGFMFATTQPLTDFKVLALKNVLVSEQDVIFDMKVQARNPNIVAVTVDIGDMVIFAKSKYAGTDSEWWSRPRPGDKIARRRGINKRDDDAQDPPLNGFPTSNPNLEIGHVYELDSPLTFEGSPFHHGLSTSLGQIRVDHPGNDTIPAGSERWGRVLQHEFDLIVRGTLKYSLPLSARVRSVSVEGRVTVEPNAADQDPDTVHIIEGLTAGKSQSG